MDIGEFSGMLINAIAMFIVFALGDNKQML